MEPMEVDALLTRIYDLLYRLGLNANIFGFSYLSCAVYLSIRNPERFGTFTKEIYPEIGRLYHVRTDDIKRSIKRTLFLIWKNHPDFSGEPLPGSPSLEQFIAFARGYLETPETEAAESAEAEAVELPKAHEEAESVELPKAHEEAESVELSGAHEEAESVELSKAQAVI